MLFSKYGPKKTIFIGGVLLTSAHILAAVLLMGNFGNFIATLLMFIVGVVGGQGACIIFFSALGAMLKQHSIICTSLVRFYLAFKLTVKD